MQKSLRQVHLKYIARANVIDRPLNSLLVCGRGEVASQPIVTWYRELR
jgi:hypothetical protein